MSINIISVADAQVDANILLYGPSGSGKTHLCGTAPRPILHIDCEGGSSTLLKVKGDGPVDTVKIKTWDQIEEVMAVLGGEHKYRTVCLDSLTEVQRKISDMIQGDKPKLTIQDYGVLKHKTESLIRWFRDQSFYFVATAIEDTDQNDEGAIIMRRPCMTGSVKKNVSQYFDVVGLCAVKAIKNKETGETEIERRLIVEMGETWEAKDRMGALGKFAPLDLSAIIAATIRADVENRERLNDPSDMPPGMVPNNGQEKE